MKAIRFIRRVDELGRIVLPADIRKQFSLDSHDALEILIEDNNLVLRKYQPCCVFCDSSEDVFEYHGKTVCRKCAKEMANQ
jgi:transcriptional pleiotropic regulator of transition state genes